ncbi:UNVERIFIED_ORG: hypothetical protein QE446_004908 [Rhizobium sp. SORGH_AS260]|nr:hypothetical protein [Rhizobium sp. SORGH_AS_0285]MDP9756984.1 hypothetical protein [Rhizobium sp. SORGH_AS_0260]MDR6083767.1 hypothetical protein [Agrobacterium sp. SORGH_AS_0440]
MLATKVYQPMGLGPNDRRLSTLISGAPAKIACGA